MDSLQEKEVSKGLNGHMKVGSWTIKNMKTKKQCSMCIKITYILDNSKIIWKMVKATWSLNRSQVENGKSTKVSSKTISLMVKVRCKCHLAPSKLASSMTASWMDMVLIWLSIRISSRGILKKVLSKKEKWLSLMMMFMKAHSCNSNHMVKESSTCEMALSVETFYLGPATPASRSSSLMTTGHITDCSKRIRWVDKASARSLRTRKELCCLRLFQEISQVTSSPITMQEKSSTQDCYKDTTMVI